MDQDAEGTDEACSELLGGRDRYGVIYSAEMRVAGGFAQLAGFALEQDRVVGLPEEECDKELEDAVEDCDGVEDPAPGRGLGYVASYYRTEGWPEERREVKDREGLATLRGSPAVAEDTGRDTEDDTGSEAGEEAADYHHAFCGCEAANKRPDEVEGVGGLCYGLAAVDLGKRCEDYGTYEACEDEGREDNLSLDVTSDVDLLGDLRKSRCDHGGGYQSDEVVS